MAILVLLLLSFMLLANEATAEDMVIGLGSSLSPKGNKSSSWVSSAGHFAFGFYPQGDDGFAVGIWLVGSTEVENTVVWTANRDDPPVSSNSRLELTKDGQLLLWQGGEGRGQPLIANLSNPAASASMLDSGNFVIYGNAETSSNVVWQSFDYPTDTILGGQSLTNGKKLVSSLSKSNHSSGLYFLSMQYDNNLVAYPRKSSSSSADPYWASGTYRPATFKYDLYLNKTGELLLRNDGDLTTIYPLYDDSSTAANIIKKNIYRATLDFDRNLRLYQHQFEAEGSSFRMLWEALHGECQIKGFCGFNSYCSNSSGKAVCACYPGFFPSQNNGGNMFLHCQPDYSKNDCELSDDPTLLYDVALLEEISLLGIPYFVTQTNMEACGRSCKQDCDCGGALFSNTNVCSKYSLPLRHGTVILNSSATGLFKVPTNYTMLTPPPMKPEVVVDNKKSLVMALAFTLGSISLLCVTFVVHIFFTYRRQVNRYRQLSASSNLGFTEECSLRSFSFDELEEATGGFTEEVGRGSFGAVYRGTVGDESKRRIVAVKRLEKIDEGEREFRAEITAIARTHHRNLVQLIGFCIDGSRKLLVYEYLSNGSLANLLFKATEKHVPSKEKIKMALDVARGVQYLHEECEVRIIHCNLKPQNILMDETWTAKISDFGFARLLKPQHSRIRAEDERMSGYLAPEWQKEPSASAKADIYSYGVILLEIVCRRRSIEVNVSSPDEVLLSSWVYQCFADGELNKLLVFDEGEDEQEDVDWKTLERMVKVGLWCVQDDPSLRPSMKNVILMLEGWKDIPIPPSPIGLIFL